MLVFKRNPNFISQHWSLQGFSCLVLISWGSFNCACLFLLSPLVLNMTSQEEQAGETVNDGQTNTNSAASRMDRPMGHGGTCHERRSSARESQVSDTVSTFGSLTHREDLCLRTRGSPADPVSVRADVQDEFWRGEDSVSHRPCSAAENHTDENRGAESSCVLPAASDGALVCVASSSCTALYTGAELGKNNSPHMSLSADLITACTCVASHNTTMKVSRNSSSKEHQTFHAICRNEAEANTVNSNKSDFYPTTDGLNTNTSANSEAPVPRGIRAKTSSSESGVKMSHITPISNVEINIYSPAPQNKCDSHKMVDDKEGDGNTLGDDDKTTLETTGDTFAASRSSSDKRSKTIAHIGTESRDKTTSHIMTDGMGQQADFSLRTGSSRSGQWAGQQLQSQGVSVIRRLIFSYLPALDLLHCCRVCRFWQLDAASELGRRPQMTWHTQYSADTSPQGRDHLWQNINTFLRELWLPASHVMLLMTKGAWTSKHPSTDSSIPSSTRKQHGDVVSQLARNLPADCVISGGIAGNGLTGTSSDLGETVTYEKWEMAVTLLVLGRASSLQLVPHDMLDGQHQLNSTYPSSRSLPCRPLQRSKLRSDGGVKDFSICLGTTPGLAESYLTTKGGRPTFFLGSWPSFHSLDLVPTPAHMRQAREPQCLRVAGRQVGQAVLSTLNVTTSRQLADLHANLHHFASTLHLRQRGLLALQHVTYSTACSQRSKQRFHRLLRALNGLFRQVLPRLPLLGVLSEGGGGEGGLWRALLDRACHSGQGQDTEPGPGSGRGAADSSAHDPSLEIDVSQDDGATGKDGSQPLETEQLNEENFCRPLLDVVTNDDVNRTRVKNRGRSLSEGSTDDLSSVDGSSDDLATDCLYAEREGATGRLAGRKAERLGVTCGVHKESSGRQNICDKYERGEEVDQREFSTSHVFFRNISVSDTSDVNDDDYDDFRDTSDDDWDDDDVMDIGYNDYDDCHFDLFTLFLYVTDV